MESGGALDFASGVPIDHLPDGDVIQGKVGGEDVVLARRGEEFFAVGAFCTHYGGPLAKGLVVGDELRCPLHHACFSLRTGEPVRPPAFDAIPCWRVERLGQSVFVREKLPAQIRKRAAGSMNLPKPPVSVVIIGGGGAGLVAADTLRRGSSRRCLPLRTDIHSRRSSGDLIRIEHWVVAERQGQFAARNIL